MKRRRAKLEQLDVDAAGRGGDSDARAGARTQRWGSHLDTALLQLFDGGIEMLDFQAEMRTSHRTRRRRLHYLDERVAVDLKVREIRRAVRLAKRKRLAKSHLTAIKIDGAFVVGDADRDVIEPNDAPLLCQPGLHRNADNDSRNKHTDRTHLHFHPVSIGLAGSAVI